ncbi:MAG TPA: hypothetical protein VI306_20655 [Pyrinomonadaceae bacterium]
MSDLNCKTVQRELDEMRLGDEQSVQVTKHLRQCNECREFVEKQTKLRQLVGSLGTVAAPADFDFRLRARLAHENANAGFHLSGLLNFGQRGLLVATALVLLVAAIVSVRYLTNRNTNAPAVATTNTVAPTNEVKQTGSAAMPKPSEEVITPKRNEEVAVNDQVTKETSARRVVVNKSRVKPPLSTAEFSSERAPVVGQQTMGSEPVFPIDASQQSLRFSLFDGRGNSKTISVPSVSFGSQKLVPTTTSYSPKGAW